MEHAKETGRVSTPLQQEMLENAVLALNANCKKLSLLSGRRRRISVRRVRLCNITSRRVRERFIGVPE